MASHVIYREGLNWLESMQPEQIFKVALDYIDAERNIEKWLLNFNIATFLSKNKLLKY